VADLEKRKLNGQIALIEVEARNRLSGALQLLQSSSVANRLENGAALQSEAAQLGVVLDALAASGQIWRRLMNACKISASCFPSSRKAIAPSIFQQCEPAGTARNMLMNKNITSLANVPYPF